MTRILWSSNASWSNTGYGTQTRYIVPGLRALGHDVAVLAWWGLQGGPAVIDGVQHYPGHLDGYGNDCTPHYVRRWRADLLITLIDLWVLDPNLGHLGHCRWAPYFPVDHADPLPPAIGERFQHAHRLIVYSQYAAREVAAYEGGKYAAKVRYVPHGVDASVYRPARDEERAGFRRRWFPDWPEDAFVIGMVAANKGHPSRKSFPEALEAFALFAQACPQARLYLHSHHGSEFRGPDLQQLAKQMGILDRTRFANPTLLIGGDYTDEQMRELYCGLDVLLAPSQGEGFGLPILESQSSGTSVIVTDHSAMSELCGVGWRVRPLRLTPSLLGGRFAEADVAGLVHALHEAYRRPRAPHWADVAHQFARQYDWPVVMRDYWAPLLDELDGGRREMALELQASRA